MHVCSWQEAPTSGCIECKLELHHWQTSKQSYTIHATGRTSKANHLLCCQMLRCQDQCPRCPMFQVGSQTGFGTSLTQLVSATPCQHTELMYICETRQWQQRSTSTHAELTDTQYAFWHQGVNLPASLDSIYLCEVVIPYKTMSPDWDKEKWHSHTVQTL